MVYSLDLLCLQLPESGQAWSVQLCTQGWVRHGGVYVVSVQPRRLGQSGPGQGEGPCVLRAGLLYFLPL